MKLKKGFAPDSLIARVPISGLFVSSFLLFSTLTWFYLMRIVVFDFVKGQDDVVIYGALTLAIISSAVLGTFIVRKIKRIYILYVWVVIGVITSIISVFWTLLTLNAPLLAFLFGFSFGFGIPSSLSYFADSVTFENRGRNAGLLFALTNLLSLLFLSVLGENVLSASIAASLWRILSLCTLLLVKPHKTEKSPRKSVTFKSVFSDRSFALFFLPWLMFCLVDSLERPYTAALATQFVGEDFAAFDRAFEPLIGTVFALFAGIVADRFGRKRVILSGFIALGTTFATLSLAPTIQIFWYIASAVNGIAWGMFYVIFVIVLWGDLSSENVMREMYFVLGGFPLFFADFLSQVISPFVQNVSRETVFAAFPIASFLLFLSVFPLMYAPETLPEKKIRDRELRDYVEKAKKVKEKRG